MTFKELRALSGMSQRKFASYFGIPRRTIENWDSGDRTCAPYLINLMRYKLEQEGIIPREDTEI
jgi:DNA-binding transcriptional regulator YiaG